MGGHHRDGPSDAGPTEGLIALLEAATGAVARVRAALAAGETPDLQATAELVDRALAALGGATEGQLPAARLKLLGLLDEVSALVVEATEIRGELAARLGGLSARRRAIAAYAGNRGGG